MMFALTPPLTLLLQDRPATDTGVHYSLPDLVAMRKCELVRSMGQAVSKQQPTQLELLVACSLCQWKMSRFIFAQHFF